jgi:pimeloyl-ACP methyl ester carboxylesterase
MSCRAYLLTPSSLPSGAVCMHPSLFVRFIQHPPRYSQREATNGANGLFKKGSALRPMTEERFFKVGPYNIRCLSAGEEGPAVILLHGLAASADIWEKNLEALAEGYRFYAPDLPGFGLSERPKEPLSSAMLIRFLADFMDTLGIDRATLIGLSLGGALALGFALTHPDNIEKLVLVSSAGLGKETSLALRLASIPGVGELFIRPNRRAMACLLRRIVYDADLITEDFVDRYYGYLKIPASREAIVSVLRGALTFRGVKPEVLGPFLTGLRTITVPTLIVWGRQDRIFPVRHAFRAREEIREATLYVFEKCGHLPNFEHPQTFNRIVRTFLRKSVSGS